MLPFFTGSLFFVCSIVILSRYVILSWCYSYSYGIILLTITCACYDKKIHALAYFLAKDKTGISTQKLITC